jgi:hypothetical protein
MPKVVFSQHPVPGTPIGLTFGRLVQDADPTSRRAKSENLLTSGTP